MGQRFRLLLGVLVLSLIVVLGFSSCGKTSSASAPASTETKKASVDVSDEEYVVVRPLAALPQFVDLDDKGLKAFADEVGIKYRIAGPADWDMDAFAQALDTVVGQKPDGIIVYGFSPSVKNSINRAMDAGIPVVCVDGDIPDSKRLTFVGTNWYDAGAAHAREIAHLIGEKGKVAVLMITGTDFYELALSGYINEIKKHKDVEFLGVFNDNANVEEVARVTSDLIAAHPDLAGISGFDSASNGIGTSLKEADMVGKIKVTAQDMNPPQLKLLKDGTFQVLVGQKRTLFGYYGAKMIYDYLHSPNSVTGSDASDKKAHVSKLPERVYTGMVIINKDNIGLFE